MQLYWHHTSAWMISSKFAALLQNTFSEERLWRTAAVHLHYGKKHIFLVPLHSYSSSVPVLYEDSHPYSLHSHPDSPYSHPDSHHSHLDSPHFHLDFPHSYHPHPDSQHSLHSHPDSPHSHPDFPHSHHSPHPVIPFPDSPFKLLQIAKPECYFLDESTKIERTSFPYKTATSEANVKTNRRVTTKWTTKNGVLPVTIFFFFWKFCFSIRTSYKELICCAKNPNTRIWTFCRRRSFIWRCFSPVNILNCLLYETFVWSLLRTGIKLTMKIYWLFLISHFSVIDVAFYDV